MDCAIWKFTCSAIFIVRLVWVLLFLLGCLLFLLCLCENVLDRLMWFNFYSYFWLGFFIIEQGNMALFLCYCFEPFYFWASLLEMINNLFSQTCCWKLFGFEEIRLLARADHICFNNQLEFTAEMLAWILYLELIFFSNESFIFLTGLLLSPYLCDQFFDGCVSIIVNIILKNGSIYQLNATQSAWPLVWLLSNGTLQRCVCSGFPSQINSVCEIGCLFYSIFNCVLSCWSILRGQSCLKFIIFHRYRSLCLVIYSKYHIR